MNKLHTLFLTLVTLLAIFICVGSFFTKVNLPGQILRLLMIPTTFYLIVKLVSQFTDQPSTPSFQNVWFKLLTFYSLIVSSTFIAAGIMSSSNQQQFLTSLVFAPIALYFFVSLWPQKSLTIGSFPSFRPSSSPSYEKLDEDKRDFLKMLGAAGLSVLLLNLFSRRTVDYLPFLNPTGSAAKKQPDAQDTAPTQSPTAGYFITQIDDGETAYFGFTNSLGQWYIMREETGQTYRYSKGDRDFSSNWATRSTLKYDYFENVF